MLIVVTLDGSATDVGLVSAARWTPYLLFGLLVGVLVDRYRRRPVLVATDVGRGVLLGLIPLLAALDLLSVGVLMLFVAVFGAMSLVNDAAYQSFLPRLVPRTLLTRANARLEQSASVAQTTGPVLAGGLIAILGAPLAVLVDAVSYLLSGLLLATIAVSEPAAQPERWSRRGLGRDIREGLAWVYRHRMLAPLALTTHAWFLFFSMCQIVLIPFALRELGLGAFGLGVVFAAAGVGGLLGSLASTGVGQRYGAGPTVIGARVLMPAAFALIALAPAAAGGNPWPGWLMVGAGEFLLGLSIGVESPNEMGYWQAVTPDRLQGRMNATRRSINRAMIVLGAPVGGLLGDALGYRTALWIGAAGLLSVPVALGLSRFRQARDTDLAPT